MKIVLLCPKTPRINYGGIEKFVLKIAKYVEKQGDEVEIFCTSKQPKDTFIGKIKVREFPGFSPNESYYFSLPLLNALKTSDADIIHCLAYSNLLMLEGLISKKKNQKFILSINIGGSPPLFRRILHLFYTPLINLFAKKIDKVLCYTELELEEYSKKLKVPKKDFLVIQTGTDIEAIKKVKAGKKKNYIISPGRFVKIKNFHHLIPSFAKISKNFPETKLLLIGSGPMEKQLRTMVKQLKIDGKVIFEKPVPLNRMNEVHKKIKESKLVALLTDCGSECTMGCEAIACGVPVLFADSKGATKSVQTGDAHAVKNPKDHDEVAKKIEAILSNPKKFTPKNPKLLSWAEATPMTYAVYTEVFKQINKKSE